MYKVPILISDEPKWVGGRMTLKHFLFLICGVGLGALLFYILNPFFGLSSLGFAATPAVLGYFLPIAKIKHDITLDRLLVYTIRFKKRPKMYVYRNYTHGKEVIVQGEEEKRGLKHE